METRDRAENQIRTREMNFDYDDLDVVNLSTKPWHGNPAAPTCQDPVFLALSTHPELDHRLRRPL